MTWKFTQPKPIGLSSGAEPRLQQLSTAKGVVSRSDGNTQASAPVSIDKARHSLNERATHMRGLHVAPTSPISASPTSPRYTRWRMSA